MKPVYRNNAAYAREHGELEEYRESNRLNHDCKTQLQTMIAHAFDGMHLSADEVLDKCFDEYGPERVAYILANTIHQHDWDARFAKANKEWAEHVLPDPTDKVSDVCLTTHPAVLDGFVDSFRNRLYLQMLNWDGRHPEYQCSAPVLLQAMDAVGYWFSQKKSGPRGLCFVDPYEEEIIYKDWSEVSQQLHELSVEDVGEHDRIYWIMHPERFPLNTRKNYYDVYQLDPNCPDRRSIAYISLEKLHEQGKSVDPENYQRVYWNHFTPETTLEDIYTRLNSNRPRDYFAASLSVSDIVVMRGKEGEPRAWYVDRFGFSEVPEFLEKIEEKRIAENAEAERATDLYEAEYGADGWRAYGGKAPAVARRTEEAWTVTYRVYGPEGHLQHESINPSERYDWSEEGDIRVVDVRNFDITGTNLYTEVAITRNTFEECQLEMEGQLSDGIFENSAVGRVVHLETIRHLQDEDFIVFQAVDETIDIEDTPVPRRV